MGMRHLHNARLLGATALIATLALAGCSGSAQDNKSASTTGGAPGLGVAGPAAPAERRAEGGTARDQAQADKAPAAAQPGQAPNLAVDQRSIIYTGSITVRVKNVNAAAAQVSGFATGSGGFVGGDNRSSGADGSGGDHGTLTLRVPSGKFATVIDQIAGLGKEQNRATNTEDVTEEVVDLDARIATQQARVDSGRRLLAQAKTLNDLVMLENEVGTRQADLASLQAKKRRLADLTALSTVTVDLLGPEVVVKEQPDSPPGFLAGLKGGWNALVASLSVLLTVLGALLPWLLALGIPAYGIFWLIRRYARRPHPAMAPAGMAAAVPAPAGTTATSADAAVAAPSGTPKPTDRPQ
ncbi:DUF4349 domain-containing protein [Krasilnikovia sp. MM14-A1004]|uniref:DUF4349 domain-containing protein n=1 Tax=Krasilnikovia sp. MM14-A1004 TaxID=3373541 RepID=UPI00399CB085